MTDETSDLRLSSVTAGAEVRIAVTGELDLSTCDALTSHLNAVIDTGDGDVVLDLSAVSFCDSTALQALIHARQRLLDLGRRLRVTRPSRPVDRVMWLSGLAELFYIPEACGDL